MLFKTAQLLQNKRSLLLLIIFLLKSLAEAQVYDPHQKKGDSPLLSTKCNSSTIIYFEFNPTSILTCGSSAECSVVFIILGSLLQHPAVLRILMFWANISNIGLRKHRRSNNRFQLGFLQLLSLSSLMTPRRILYISLFLLLATLLTLIFSCKQFH